METETTRQLVQQFLQARADGDAAALAALLAEEAEWYPPPAVGIGPFIGRDDVARALTGGAAGRFLDVSSIRRDVRKVVVEGDTAVVLQRLTARTVNDTDYVNEYCWIYTCRDGAIVRLDEYADTLHAARVFGLLGT
jgi:ketosteroid isomerase-like protein